MITALHINSRLRIATGILLLLLIGLKVCAPLYASEKGYYKQVVITTENDNDSNGEKKPEPANPLEKEKEFTNIYSKDVNLTRWYTHIRHLTAYNNNYQTSFYIKVSIPPPDSDLHYSV